MPLGEVEDEKPAQMRPTRNILDILYEVKAKCFSVFSSYETIIREVDSGFQQKLVSMESSQPNPSGTEQST